MKRENLQRLVLSAVFLSLGLVLPFFTGQIKEIGDSLLPMHLPVMLCGAVCGWKYGALIGVIMPFLRSITFGMPPLYPNAIWMALELATYGFVIGFLYFKMKKQTVPYLLLSLVIAMLAGRVAWGVSKAILLGVGGKGFTMHAFIVGGFIEAIPGIIIQLVLVPLIIGLLKHTGLKNLVGGK